MTYSSDRNVLLLPLKGSLIAVWRGAFLLLLAHALLLGVAPGQGTFSHFEARQTHPIALSADGTRLFVLNSPDGRLSIFDIASSATAPVLLSEVPVGIEPVSVAVRTSDEVWVVNEVSDTISIVSVSLGLVVDTIRTPDEPADVVFANGKAFVTCARSNAVRVFDATSRAVLATIPLQGLYPRAIVANAAGTRVYAAFLHSGNRTTILPASQAPAQPAPTNSNLPAPPQVGLLVAASDSRIRYNVVDNDIVEIDTANHSVVKYFTSIGTNLFALALRPTVNELWALNSDARNLTRFEPALRGHFSDHRASRITLSNSATAAFDLNPGVNYGLLPNPTAQASALAQPMAIAWNPAGDTCWVAAFASDRVAKISSTGAIQARIDVRTAAPTGTPNDSRRMRGPRGLALSSATNRLYVLNKLANTVSVIDTATTTVLAEFAAGSHDPMPLVIKEGRGFLFDARLSGNGTVSCGVCHIDADNDGIAWDLGDPGGDMFYATGVNFAALHETTIRTRDMHPMKGPMVTQTLRGMSAPFHWRGDRPTLQDFNPTFDHLMGGAQLIAADMDAMAEYLLTLRHHPNPNRNPDNTLQTNFNGAGANAVTGRQLFIDNGNHCRECHPEPGGTDNNIDDKALVNSVMFLKNPSLRTTYQRNYFTRTNGATSLSGFGMAHNGSQAISDLPRAHFYTLDFLEPGDLAHVTAFVLSFDSGTYPSVGFSRTVNATNSASSTINSEVLMLENQAVAGRIVLTVQGLIGGLKRSFYFDVETRRYRSDRASDAVFTRAQFLAAIGAADSVTFMGVPPSESRRHGGDRDGDGVLDLDEAQPPLRIEKTPTLTRLSWPVTAPGWILESAASLATPFARITQPPVVSGSDWRVDLPPNPASAGYYRLRRSW